MNSKYLYNPFVIIAGVNSLLIGLLGLLVTSYLSFLTGTHFSGLINVDFAKDSLFWIFLLENTAHWLVLSALFFVIGSVLSKSKVRAVDVFGTTIFSRIPLIITPLFRIIPYFQSFAFYSLAMYILISIYLISIIWTFVLLYNAFKISCNLKSQKLYIPFLFSIILSEVIIKTILYIVI